VIRPKMTFYFKFTALILMILFLWQAQGLLAQEVNFAEQYKKAMEEYKKSQYDRARDRLERLAAVYRRIENKTPGMKVEYIKTLMVLGACHKRAADASWNELIKTSGTVEKAGKKNKKDMDLTYKDFLSLLKKDIESTIYKKVSKELKRIGVF